VIVALILLIFVGGLVAYKTTGSLAVLANVQTNGIYKARFDLFQPGASWQGALNRTFSYFVVIWPALLFGILISSAVRTFVSPEWLARLFAGLAGTPLMLCSCCVAPVFAGVYERTERLAPSLALMLAAPSLNPAALILTFMLFGGKVGAIRLVIGIVAVLITGLFAERFADSRNISCRTGPKDFQANRSVSASLGLSIMRVAVQTLPLIVLGVVLSMLITWWLPESGLETAVSGTVAVVLFAFVATLIAMPTFFELPLTLLFVSAGLPFGVAMAILIAGPATNLPSLLTVGRLAGWRPAVLVGISVWILSIMGGLLIGLV
jgi:uncharacterized membrane protein YraQ (UPF0718 family)